MTSKLRDLGYLTFFLLTSPYFFIKMLRTGKYREGLRQRLGAVEPRKSTAPCVWIHGVSVGEVLAAKSFVAEFERRHPDWELVISSTTNTGIEVAKKHYPRKKVFYFPLDFSCVTRGVIGKIRPSVVILMELEVWPNFIRAAEREGAKVIILNYRISEKAFKLQKRFRVFIKKSYERIAHICAQTEQYAGRLIESGVDARKIEVTGSMKYDSVCTEVDEKEIRRLKEKLGFKEGQKILLGASTHRSEEAALLDVFSRLKKDFPALCLIIVPRHAERFNEVAALLDSRGVNYIRKSRIDKGERIEGDAIILADTMGELAEMTSISDIVFVGGSLIPHGGQNMLEAAGLAKAVLFGPHIFNFQETVDLLLEEEAALMVHSAEELEANISRLLKDAEKAAQMGQRARRVIEARKGATMRNVKAVEKVLEIERPL